MSYSIFTSITQWKKKSVACLLLCRDSLSSSSECQYSRSQHNYSLAVINIFSTGKMVGLISASNFKVSFKIVYLPNIKDYLKLERYSDITFN